MSLIHIDQWPRPVESARHRILEAALEAGVPFPHGCGSGECGACKCQLLSGEVSLDAYSPQALTDAEREDGLILACRARPSTDVRLRWLTEAQALPVLPTVTLEARVERLEHVAHDVVVLTLTLPPGKPFVFRPGQFARLRIGRLPARSYSMANQPGEGRLEFHVRVLPDGQVSTYVADGLQVGDPVELQGPFGDACWSATTMAGHEPLLLVAGGTGLAPILSVLDAALADGVPPGQIHLYHGVRAARDLYAGQRLHAHVRDRGLRFVPVLSEAGDGNMRRGFVHDAVAEDFDTLAEARIFVAGPPPMVKAVKVLALQRGAAVSRIRADAFVAAEQKTKKKSLWERISGWGPLAG